MAIASTAQFSALADLTRLEIFELVAERPRAVGERAGELPVSRPAVSQHLKVLKGAGLVYDRAVGNRRIYAVDPTGWGRCALRWPVLEPGAGGVQVDHRATHPQGDPMTVTTAVPVTETIVVDAPIDRAFEVFTAGIGSWWPPSHHVLRAELAEMVFEPRVGGHIIDRGTDGSECRWARVLAYEPPARIVFSWDISLDWQIETDPARTSEVEVRFIAESEDRTRVELEHRGIERHGDGWESMHAAVGSPNGWLHGLERFAVGVSSRGDDA